MRVILVLVKVLSCPWTSQPNALALVEEDEGNGDQQNRDKAKQTGGPFVVQLLVHLGRKQRETRPDDIANQNHPGKGRGGIGLVAINNVVENAQNHNVDARAEEGRRDNGHNPVDRPVAGPSKPEETDRDQQGTTTSHPHPCLRNSPAVVLGNSAEVVSLLEGIQTKGNERTDGHAEEGQALLTDVEGMPLRRTKDQWNGLVEEVHQAIQEAIVDSREGGDGLGKEKAERAGKGDGEQFVQALATAGMDVDRRLGRSEILLFHLLAHALGLPLENRRVSCLGDRDHQNDPNSTRHRHQDPKDPPPAEIESDIARDHQGHGGSKCAAQAVHGHGATALVPLPQVTDATSSIGQWGTAGTAGNEPTHQDGADVGRQSERELEDEEKEPRYNIDRLSAKVLGQRREKNGTDGISQHVQRQA